MIEIPIKALSVNQAWQGRRFKSPAYKKYEHDLIALLPKHFSAPDNDLLAVYEFGVSSPLSDWDNPVKPFQDVLQKKYGFDDRKIKHAQVTKTLVKKGKEYIRFTLKPLDTKPDCYQCRYAADVKSSAYKQCKHPSISEVDLMAVLAGKAAPTQKALGVSIDQHGIDNHWCYWPTRFDPVWIDQCDGYHPKS